MLREHRRLLDAIHAAMTVIWIAFAFVLVHALLMSQGHPILPLDFYLNAIVVFCGLVVVAVNQTDFSAAAPLSRPGSLLRGLASCWALGLIGFFSFAYMFRIPHYSRLFLLGGAAVGYVFSAVWHIGVHIYYRDSRARGVNQRMALVVGDSYSLPGVLAAFSSNAGSALKPIAVLSTDDVNPALLPPGVKCEKLSRLKEILNTTVVDCAVFCIYRQDPQRVEVAMLACQERGIEVWLKMDFLHQEVAVSTVDYLQDIPMFIFSMGPRYSLALLLKRLIDIAVAAAVLAILALPLALVAALIPWFNPGPIFFRQRRVGLNGREFTVYKFRSMYVDAESRREEYSLKNEMHGPVFKMQKDPRVTPFGRLLRKYSIDEFPQLWNVLVGDMSLVGPRPPLPSEVNQYSGWQRRRLSMRPGISGLWQIRGRNRIADFADWVRLDLKYIDEWSLWLDFKILAMTVPTVLRGTGY